MKRVSYILILLCFVCSILLSSCGVKNTYDEGIDKVTNAKLAAANGMSCLSLKFAEINLQTGIMNNYYSAVVKNTEAYRQWLGAQQQANNAFAQKQNAYVDPTTGLSVDPSKLDLAQLQETGALPSDAGLTLQIYATSFTEAPMPDVDPVVAVNTQRLTSEAFNQAFSCIEDWNSAATDYNKWALSISGTVMTEIAKQLGVERLPTSLPLYTMQPGAIPVAPTFAP